jgi:hypothetical protein
MPTLDLEITEKQMKDAISLVNLRGYASLELPSDLVVNLGASLYRAMDAHVFHPDRQKYYNEIAFYWPEDWRDVDLGLAAFHEEKSLRHILPFQEAQKILSKKIGAISSHAIFDFVVQIKRLIVQNHHGLKNNELRLSRVMVRQMNEGHLTTHGGSDVHEDIGYSHRPYRQLLSAIVTTYGIPTESKTYQPKIGELLIFNAYDRRKLLGLNDDLAFLHKGPKSGPKMFFFFEFLGPRD